jgi:hypothetical protein
MAPKSKVANDTTVFFANEPFNIVWDNTGYAISGNTPLDLPADLVTYLLDKGVIYPSVVVAEAPIVDEVPTEEDK